MIPAILGNKARKSFWEDEVTGSLFSPLLYTDKSDTCQFLYEAFLAMLEKDSFMTPESFSMEFWPRLPAQFRGHSVEPDLLFHFSEAGTGKRWVVIVEVKWESGQSGNDQLVRQWNAVNNKYGSYNTEISQIYLVIECEQGESDIQSSVDDAELKKTFSSVWNSWRKNLTVCDWHSFSRAIVKTKSGSEEIVLYATNFSETIGKLLGKVFSGIEIGGIETSVIPFKFQLCEFNSVSMMPEFRFQSGEE